MTRLVQINNPLDDATSEEQFSERSDHELSEQEGCGEEDAQASNTRAMFFFLLVNAK